VLSPDGATLAFARTRSVDGDIKHMGVVLRSVSDGGERVLREYDRSVESQQWARSPEWMPDGASLVYVLATELASLRRADPNKGTHLAEVLMDAGEPVAGLARPRVAPDGQTIAVERRAAADAAWEILLRAADGTITQVGPGTRVAWRADGAAFAFVRLVDGEGSVMLATLADPSHPTPMTLGDHDVRGVAWHPDGRLIIEAGLTADRADLLVVDEAGVAVKLVEGTGDHGRHSVGRDGWVYFTSDVMGQLDVWRVRLK
jgi:Tol biopolymer transport system component